MSPTNSDSGWPLYVWRLNKVDSSFPRPRKYVVEGSQYKRRRRFTIIRSYRTDGWCVRVFRKFHDLFGESVGLLVSLKLRHPPRVYRRQCLDGLTGFSFPDCCNSQPHLNLVVLTSLTWPLQHWCRWNLFLTVENPISILRVCFCFCLSVFDRESEDPYVREM